MHTRQRICSFCTVLTGHHACWDILVYYLTKFNLSSLLAFKQELLSLYILS